MILKTDKKNNEEELFNKYDDSETEEASDDNLMPGQMILPPEYDKEIEVQEDVESEIVDVETDYIDESMIDDVEELEVDSDTGEILENQNVTSMSGEEYMMAKLNACNRYFREPECDSNCPLNVNCHCLHAEIKDAERYRICEERLLVWSESLKTTNGYMIMEVLKAAGIDFDLSYLSEQGKAWYERKAT